MTQDDYPALAEILQDQETMYAYEGAFSDAETQEWLNKNLRRYTEDGFGLWAVVLKESGRMIRQCGITMQDFNGERVPEIGYLFNRAFWHNGYAIEAAIACKTYAFETLKIDTIYTIIRDRNIASINVAIRNGMIVCGRFIKHYRGVDMPHLVFSAKNPIQKEFSVLAKTKIANYPIINPVPIVIVGTPIGGNPNYTTVGAFGVVCLEPIFYISLKDTHYVTEGIQETGFFSVNLPSAELVAPTNYCGMVSGHNTDKSGLFETFYDESGKAPLILGAPMNYLCKVVNTFSIGGFTVFFGEIISTYVSEEFMTDGKPDPQKVNPIIGMGMSYYGLGKPIGKVFDAGKALKENQD